jgi:hypothetical protein
VLTRSPRVALAVDSDETASALWTRRLSRPVFYTVAAIALTWPLASRLTTHLGALVGPGDPYLNLWILGWDLNVLTTTPAALLTGRIFDANIFYPAAGTLAYSEHLILQAIALLPVYWLTGDPVTCYNVLLLGSLIASGLAMHAYVRTLTGSESGAYVAGTAWAFWPYRFSHLLHLQLQALYFLPLALLFLHRVIAGRRRRDVALLGICAGLQVVSSLNYGVIAEVALVVVALALLVGVGRWRSPAVLGRLLVAAAIGALVALPFVWPYWRAQQREGFGRNLDEASRHAARPASYLQVPPENRLYGRTHLLSAHDAAGHVRAARVPSVEHALFPGFVLGALALGGVWRGRRLGNWPNVWAMVLLAGVGVVLSLGPDGIRWLYAGAYRWIFGFHAIRAPARFAVLVTCAAATLAGVALSSLAGRVRLRRALGVAAVAAMLAEYVSAPLPWVERPRQRTPVGQWLASAEGPGAVVHLPLTFDERNTPPMVQSLEHWRPVVNGHSGQRPPFFASLVDALSDFPSAEALWTLRDFNVRFVVAAAPVAQSGESPLVERARFEGDCVGGTSCPAVIYELVWTPEREAQLPRPAPPPPPPPGRAPFFVGERATYDVRWLGGGLDMSAGRATVTVHAAGERGYELVARAQTAAWVRQFFDAENEYSTIASGDLLPLRHTRHEQQGRRDLTRVFEFDHTDRHVQIVSGAGDAQSTITLAIPPGTRDALTALYYTRSITLGPNQVVRVPLNDGGRNLILELRAAGEEDIRVGDRVRPAIRLEPRVIQRVARRRPLELTVWLSRDAHRVPLRADVSAGFGRVRLDLVEYTPR